MGFTFSRDVIAVLQLKLFGPFEVKGSPDQSYFSNTKVRALLAYLVLAETRAATRERLTDLLWGSRFDTQASQSFRQALARLKKAVGAEKLLVNDQGIRLASDKIETDVDEFLRLVRTGSEEAVRRAVEIAQGEFLSGIDIKEAAWEEWLQTQRSRLVRLLNDSSVILGDIEFGRDDFKAALSCGEAVNNRDYFREDAHRLVMQCLAKLGRRAEALKRYQELTSRIKAEFGVSAEPATVECYEALKRDLPARQVSGTGGERVPVPGPSALVERRSIAVLPFTNLSNDPQHAPFAQGLTDDLITDLSRAGRLFVVPSFTYDGRSADVRAIARDLGVDYVLEGSAQRAGGRVRINVKLLEARAGATLWAERFDRDLSDIFAVQDEVVASIAEALLGRLAVTRIADRKRPTSMEAYDLCVRARPLIRQSAQSASEARILLERAVALDPEYSEAYRWLALATYVPWWFGAEPKRNHSLALAHARKAIQLDENDPDAHCMLGTLLVHELQLEEAEAEFACVLRLDPNNADTWAMLSEFFVRKGKSAEALGMIEKAFRVNPYPPGWHYWLLGQAYFLDGQYERAVVTLRHELTYRTESRRTLAASLALLGRTNEAQHEAKLFMAMNPVFTISHWIQSVRFADKSTGELFVEAYRKAGLPD